VENELRTYLEDKFKMVSDELTKMESSIVRLFDKMDNIALKTNDNSKDIEHLKKDGEDIRKGFDDKLKGFRITHEGCQKSCEKFRADIIKQVDEKDSASETKIKNWFLGLAVTGGLSFIGLLLTVLLRTWGIK
jgi:predicted  nucleic acid-binding Zn-ribbon protein